MLGWMKHKLESRLLGEILITSDMQMTAPLWQKAKRSKRKSVLNIHWKDWCWSWNSYTLAPDGKNWLIEKDTDDGKDWRWEEKGTTEDEMVGSHHRLNGWVWASSGSLVINGEAWRAILHGVTKCWTWLSYWTELNQLFKIESDGLGWGHYEKLLDSCKGNSQI